MENVPDLTELKEIVVRLRQLSDVQGLLQQAYAGYAEWYQVAPKELARPEDVQINFQLQTLYFQPGVVTQLPAYITTTMELSVPSEDYGRYSLFTNLDGSYRDDVMVWASVIVCSPQPDYGVDSPIEPVELRDVPAEIQDIFPQLALVARDQQLVDRATQHCIQWFQQHLTWYQHYPLSLAEEAIEKGYRWFHEWPTWYQRYTALSLRDSEVRMAFYRQVLCFNHAVYMHPHIKTYLNVYAGGYEVGSYCLATTLDGKVDETLSGIVPAPFFL